MQLLTQNYFLSEINPHKVMHKLQFLSLFAFLVFSTLSAKSQESYSQSFEGFSDGETDLGDGSMITGEAAAIEGGRLQLTRDGQGLGFSSFSMSRGAKVLCPAA